MVGTNKHERSDVRPETLHTLALSPRPPQLTAARPPKYRGGMEPGVCGVHGSLLLGKHVCLHYNHHHHHERRKGLRTLTCVWIGPLSTHSTALLARGSPICRPRCRLFSTTSVVATSATIPLSRHWFARRARQNTAYPKWPGVAKFEITPELVPTKLEMQFVDLIDTLGQEQITYGNLHWNEFNLET